MPFKKYRTETWSGTFNDYTDNGGFYYYENLDNFRPEDIIISNSVYSGSWSFSEDGTTNSSSKTIVTTGSYTNSQIIVPVNVETVGPGGTVNYTQTGVMRNLDYLYQYMWNDPGYDNEYSPLFASGITETSASIIINCPGSNFTVHTTSPHYTTYDDTGPLSYLPVTDSDTQTAQLQETLSDEFTMADAAKYAPPATLGNARVAYIGNFSRSWVAPELVPANIAPVDLTAQSVSFYAEFPSSGDNALTPGIYNITYYYTQWPIGTTQPSGPNVVVSGGQVTFKDAPFLTPSASAPIQIQPPSGFNMEIEYATATPCDVCNCSGSVAGSGSGSENSVHFRISLGTVSNGFSAGQLELLAPQVSNQLYLTSAWNAVVPTSPDIQLVTDTSGSLLQIKTPNWIVDLVQTSPSVCDVNFYLVGQITGTNSGTSRYTLSGSPFVTYEATEPLSDNGSGNQVMISEIRGVTVKQTTFTNYTASTGSGVTMSLGTGYGVERISESTSGTVVTEVRDMIDDSGNLLKQSTTVYNQAPYGQVVTSKSISTGSTPPLVTQNSYYDNASTDGAAYGHIKQALNADGSWEHYIYDAQGRLSQLLTPYLNSAPSFDPSTCRTITTTYTTVPDMDGDGIPETLVLNVQTVLGTEVGRTYQFEPSNTLTFNGDTCQQLSWLIQCINTGNGTPPEISLRRHTPISGGILMGKLARFSIPTERRA